MEQSISVRNLVEFVRKGGDLDLRFTSRTRALDGTRAHQHIQKNMGPGYESEVMLKKTIELAGMELTVQGRADGVFEEDDQVWIDEIKSTTRPLDELQADDRPLHWAQAMCYGYFVMAEEGRPSIGIQLTYVALEDYEATRFRKTFQFEELETFFYDLVHDYKRWMEDKRDWLALRDSSLQSLAFPFGGYRKGQRELAVSVYKSIEKGERGFYQAPTGIGKTMSSIFPAVKNMGMNHSDRLFYLTAKTITRTVAEQALGILHDAGMHLRSVTLTAKDKICFIPGTACNPEECTYAKGHFDRVNDAMWDMLKNHEQIGRRQVEEVAKRHHVCPFEFSLDLSMAADLVVCDYNYVFDPRVYLRRFFDESKERITLLVDEAHNLVDRSRGMFSAEVSKQKVIDVKRGLPKDWPLTKTLNKVNNALLDYRKLCEEEKDERLVEEDLPETLVGAVRYFTAEAEQWLVEHPDHEKQEEVLDLYFDGLSFNRIVELFDDHYEVLVEKRGNDVRLKLYCIDPSKNLADRLDQCQSAIFFSATLSPLGYYKRILGGRETDPTRAFPSPFDPENRLMLQATGVTTKYAKREATLDRMVAYVETFITGHPGNYFIFFPSYAYMEQVAEILYERCPDIRFVEQEREMPEQERLAFLDEFQEDNDETVVGLCVVGGIFSEGIDLRGGRLTGVAVAGMGTPAVSFENDRIRQYFDDREDAGFAYAYGYPGIGRVLQAVGRLIRTETDKGTILLLDERYSSTYYRKMLPPDWQWRLCDPSELEKRMGWFWI